MRESDLPLLFQWIIEPHVKQWWADDGSGEEFRLRYLRNIQSDDSFPFLVFFADQPIGYINYWTTESDPDFRSLFPPGSDLAG